MSFEGNSGLPQNDVTSHGNKHGANVIINFFVPPFLKFSVSFNSQSYDECTNRYSVLYGTELQNHSDNLRGELCSTSLIRHTSGGSRIFRIMGGHCFVANGGAARSCNSGKKCMKLKEIGLPNGGAARTSKSLP